MQDDQPQAYLIDVVTSPPQEDPGRALLCQVAASASVGGASQRVDTNVLITYSDNDIELAQRNGEVMKLMEEAVDFKLQKDLEAAVKSGDRQKMTSVLERKKKMTQRLGKSTATKILQDMENTLQSGGAISPRCAGQLVRRIEKDQNAWAKDGEKRCCKYLQRLFSW